MSWLYTIVFAGLMFSTNGDLASDPQLNMRADAAMPVVVVGDESEKFEQTYPLNANGRVSLSNVNGSIIVEAWDRNEVKLEYTKIADTRDRLADVEVRIDARPDSFNVETDYGNSNNRDRWRNNGKLNVEFHLMVPRGAMLNEVETVNGSVSVANFVNVTKVSAVNGSVKATNIRGTANLSTVNGEVFADFDRLESGSKISLETVNGKVNLIIPSDANATVKADSLNGTITNDFNLPVHKGKYIGRDMYGRIGSGDVQIKLSSVNGGLSVGRKSDGKTLSPSTNLLPRKDKNDEDWDMDDEDSSSPSSKAEKGAARAARAAQRDAERALRQAQRDIETARPELEKINDKLIDTEKLKEKIKETEMMRRNIMTQIANANFTSAVPRVEKKSNSFAVKGVPAVTINAKGCSVSIRGWDKNEVQYTATQLSDARRHSAIKITEDHTDTAVNIGVDSIGVESRRFLEDPNSFRIQVFVPRRSNLKITSSGEIRLESVTGDVELSGGDEAINVRDLDGKLRVTNADGRIRVIGFLGELDATTAGGSMSLEGDFNKLEAKGDGGDIVVTLSDAASAQLEASCSDVQADGIGLVRVSSDDSRSIYKIGNGGGPKYHVTTNGEVRVRGSSNLTSY
ncbi:MAG: DUF4097 family beta strand repeat-containing protein [Pyrinomonadaceae bacterium]